MDNETTGEAETPEEQIRRFRRQERDSARAYYQRFVSTDNPARPIGNVFVEHRHPASVAMRAEHERKRAVLIKSALQRSDRNTPFATATLRLIFKNGKNRRESIWAIMQKMLRTKRRGRSTFATGKR